MERANADMAFDKLDYGGNGWVEESQLEELMVSTSVIYSGEDHRPKLLSICEEGLLLKKAFVGWYDAWLFHMEEHWSGRGQMGYLNAVEMRARNVEGFAARREERANA